MRTNCSRPGRSKPDTIASRSFPTWSPVNGMVRPPAAGAFSPLGDRPALLSERLAATFGGTAHPRGPPDTPPHFVGALGLF
jgi:hypothetical protein